MAHRTGLARMILGMPPPPETWSEERGDYYADLIGAVADLGDERAIPVLLAVASTGGMATQGVARFGTRALDRVLDQARDRDPDLASGAIFVIIEMLGLPTVTDRASQLRIKKALWSAVSSPDPEIRDSVLYAVKYLNNVDREEFVPMLKQLAERDPAKLTGPHDNGSVEDVYYVRRHAKALLEMIERHERPLPRGVQGR